jgi:hypothetical protein
MIECIVHLNLTSAAFLPILGDALAEGRRLDAPAPPRYRRDLVGWLLWGIMGPPVRLRVKTTAPFVPGGPGDPSDPGRAPVGRDRRSDDRPQGVVRTFARLQNEQIACVESADGLPLGRIMIRSPFNARVKYNVYSCLTILPRHQHRHLWQAEQVWRELQSR